MSCPPCRTETSLIVFVIDTVLLTRILAHIRGPTALLVLSGRSIGALDGSLRSLPLSRPGNAPDNPHTRRAESRLARLSLLGKVIHSIVFTLRASLPDSIKRLW